MTSPLELKNQRRTFTIHFLFSLIEGALAGILLMNEYVFVKSINGSKELLATLFQSTMVILVLAVIFSELIKRTKSKKRLLGLTALFCRLPLFLFFFFPNDYSGPGAKGYHILFILIFFVYFMAKPIVLPIVNHLLKENYIGDNFGKYFSYATSANKLVALFSAFLFGVWLDYDPYAFTKLYPIMGVVGCFSIMSLAFIPDHVEEGEISKGHFGKLVAASFRNMWRILKENKAFRDFEIGFMFYGFAFMTTASAITLFQDEVLHLNYTSVGFYKSYYNILAIILLPFCGKVISKVTPEKFATATYFALFFYLFFLVLSGFYPINYSVSLGQKSLQIFPFVLLAFTAFGVFTATMALLWGIGASYYGKKGQAGTYQSIHVTLTGLRAIFAPHIGILCLALFSYTTVFTIGMISLLGGVFFLKFKK